jgi:hypothetical protein
MDDIKFAPMKFRIKDNAESILVQEKLIQMGYQQSSCFENRRIPREFGNAYLYADTDGIIRKSEAIDEEFFNSVKDSLEYIVKQTLEFIPFPDTIKIGNDEYSLNRVKQAIEQCGLVKIKHG